MKRRAAMTAAIAALTLCLAGAVEAGPDAPWKVVSVSGGVETQPATALEDLWTALARRDTLATGSWVRTGADGRATLVHESTVISVEPSTTLKLPVPAASDPLLSIRQETGAATYHVNKLRQRRVEVVTPYLVAGVKGTVFRVTVGKRTASVDVIEGLVNVRSLLGEDERNVRAGEIVRLEAAPRPQREGTTDRETAEAVSLVVEERQESGSLSADDRVALDDLSSDTFFKDEATEKTRPSFFEEKEQEELRNLELEGSKDELLDDTYDELRKEELKQQQMGSGGGKTAPTANPNSPTP